MKNKVQTNSSNTKKEIFITTGEIFPDGAIIELVRGSEGSKKPNLLLWKGSAATIASHVKYRGRIYEAPELSTSIYRSTRLPARCGDYQSLRELFNGIVAEFDQRLQLSERDSRLLAAFSLSTWCAGRLPIAPKAVISGPDERSGVELLRLLSCVCRHPLLLAELTPGGFRSLPLELSPTLLVNQQALRPPMLRLFHASAYRGLHLTGNRGELIEIYGPKAVFSKSDAVFESLSEGAIQISLAQSRSRWAALDENVQKKIADKFQGRLLSYRLKNLFVPRESPVDGAEFTAATRQLALALGACLSEDPQLAQDTVALLRLQDEDVREQRFCDISFATIEVLWGLVHHETEKTLTVDELAKLVNALLRSRGEAMVYSAEEIGWKLRALGVRRHTSAAGRKVVLDRESCQRVHHLARTYDLPCVLDVSSGCPDCREAKPAVSKRLM